MSIGTIRCYTCGDPIITHHGHYRAKRRGFGFCSQSCAGSHKSASSIESRDTYGELLKKIDRSSGDNGCWPYTGRLSSTGYGVIDINKRPFLAHRLMYMLIHYEGEPLPQGKVVCHSCDNPTCCHPDHLWLGTQGDNIRDMYAKGRKITPSVVGSNVHTAKLGDADVRSIRASDLPDVALSKQFGVSPTQIRNIRYRRHWRHVE